MALSIRYEQVTGYEELRDEIPWLREVRKMIEIESAELPRIGRDALLNLSRHYLDKAIQHADCCRLEQQPPARKSEAQG